MQLQKWRDKQQKQMYNCTSCCRCCREALNAARQQKFNKQLVKPRGSWRCCCWNKRHDLDALRQLPNDALGMESSWT